MSHDIIVVGASTGGIETMLKIFPSIPEDLNASIFVVQHIAAMSKGYLAEILNKVCGLKVVEAIDDEIIKKGYVYVAKPDYHLLIKNNRIKLVRSPKENRVRPAIDPLFRSASVNYGSRVIGVILSGALNDGTAGLISVKNCGGLAVVQSPDDAICASMPQSAMDNADVDYCLPASEIAEKLIELVKKESKTNDIIPENIIIESNINEKGISSPEEMDMIGKSSVYSCPECGGRLWEVNKENNFLRFRCHIGHAYTAANILSESAVTIDNALGVALRTIEDKIVLLRQMADDAKVLGQTNLAKIYEKQLKEASGQSDAINKLLMGKLL